MISAILTLLLIFSSTSQPVIVENFLVEDRPVLKHESRSVGVVVTAKSGIVMDQETGKVIFSKNTEEKLPIASITKLITGLVLFEEILDYNKLVTIKSEDQRAEGGNRQLYLGEQLRVEDLLYSAFMASDNEAIMALIRSQGMSEEEFIEKANKWLSENNFLNTKISDPTGLNAENISTASDIVKIAQKAFLHSELSKFFAKENYQFTIINTGRTANIKNTNRLLNGDFNVEIGKTGYTEEAGYCLTTLSNINDKEVLTVVLGSATIQDRFQDTKALIFWIRENFIF